MPAYKVLERCYMNDQLHEAGDVVDVEEKLKECDHLELIEETVEETQTRGQKAAATRKRKAAEKKAAEIEKDAATHAEDPSLSGPVDL